MLLKSCERDNPRYRPTLKKAFGNMGKGILLLLSAIPLFAQISLTPSPNALWSCTGLNCNVTQRAAGHAPFPLLLSVGGTGAINLGSCIRSACGPLAPKICPQGIVPCSTTTTAPASLYFVLDEYGNTYPPGAYTALI